MSEHIDTQAVRPTQMNTRAIRLRPARVYHIANCPECGGAMQIYCVKGRVRFTKCGRCGLNDKWIPDVPRMVQL